MKRAALLLALLGLACEDTRTVEIGFGAGQRTPVGFRCKDADGRFLVQRAVSARTLQFSLLIDFIGLGGLPTCRGGDIAAFCESHSCAVLPTPERVCIPLGQSLTGTDNAILVIGALLRSLDGRPLTDDAPHGPVIIRAVATAQPCSEVGGATTLDPERLVGCAVSCPVQLDGVDGEVILELPTLSDQCADSVLACATGRLAQ